MMQNYTEFWLNNDTANAQLYNPNIGYKRVLFTGLYTATIIANLPSIALVIWMTMRRKNSKNIHLVSIGITDGLVGIFAYLMAETYVYPDRHFSFHSCYFRYYSFSVTFVASMLHVLGICIQRLKIVISGMKTQKQRLLEWVVIVISWIVSVIINSVAFILWKTDKMHLKVCSIDTLVQGKENYFFTFLGMSYTFIVFLVATAMSILLCLLWIKRRKLPGNQLGSKDVKLCITVTMIAIIFLASTVPLTIVLLNHDSLGELRREKRAICIMVSLLNSLINPFIYMLRSSELKAVCRKKNAVANIANAGNVRQK